MERPLAVVLVLIASSFLSFAQTEPTADDRVPKLALSMQVSKQALKAGEPLTVRLELRNMGRFPVWIPQGWGEAGGGVPGFFVGVKQLSGNKKKCPEYAGDGGLVDDSDSADLLRKHYVLLYPGTFVGWEKKIDPCFIAHSGQYKIGGAYSPHFWYLSRKKPIDFSSETYGVVEHTIEAKSVLVTVH